MARRLKKSVKTFFLSSIVLVLIALIGCVLYFSFNAPQNDLTDLPDEPEVTMPDSGNQTKPDETSDDDKIQIDLVDYTVYDLDSVDFRFIIAKVRVKSNDATNISLSHFKTSEGIVLSDVESYVNQLEKNSLFLGKKNVWFELVSSENNYLANLFIPVKDNSLSTVSLSSDFKKSHAMKFDLNEVVTSKEELGYEEDDIISDGKTYQMQVSGVYLISDEITRTYESGYSEAYLLPSNAEVHGFYVEAVSLWGDAVEIESAWYQVSDTGEQFEALSGQFTTLKYKNIVNSVITDKEKGFIFFITLNPEDQPIVYKGTLYLTVKGASSPVQIQVDLQ